MGERTWGVPGMRMKWGRGPMKSEWRRGNFTDMEDFDEL